MWWAPHANRHLLQSDKEEIMTIIVGFVPTPEGRAALAYAVQEASLRRARLVVINSSRGDAVVDDHYAQEPDLAAARQTVEKADLDWELRQPVRGLDAADEVVSAAAEHDADLIVIGMRRRSPVGKLFLGSESQRILLNADCPVVAVKA